MRLSRSNKKKKKKAARGEQSIADLHDTWETRLLLLSALSILGHRPINESQITTCLDRKPITAAVVDDVGTQPPSRRNLTWKRLAASWDIREIEAILGAAPCMPQHV